MEKEYYIAKVRYDRVAEDGTTKKANENVLVSAASHGEAEQAVLEEYGHLTAGEVDIRSVSVANFAELIIKDDADERYFRAKLRFTTLDERTGKEKYTSYNIIVQAASIEDAIKTINGHMKTSVMDYSIVSVVQTNIQYRITDEEISN